MHLQNVEGYDNHLRLDRVQTYLILIDIHCINRFFWRQLSYMERDESWTVEQVGKPSFCGTDQEQWVLLHLYTPRWLKIFEEYEEQSCLLMFFVYLFLFLMLFHFMVIN